MKFLFSTYGVRGDIAPYVAIARALKTLGAHPVIATSNAWQSLVESAGVEWAFCPPQAPSGRDLARVMHGARGDERLFREWILPALRQSYDTLDNLAADADVLVTHTLSFAGPIVAQKREIPWVSSAVSPLALLEPQLAPALPVAPWAAGLPGFNRLLLRLLRRQFGMWLRPVQTLRRELGLPPGDNAIWHDAHSPLLALRLWSPQFCAPGTQGNGRAVGFCVLDEGKPLDSALESWLRNGEAPIVICAASGCNLDRWISDAAASAHQRGQRVLILGTGDVSADDGPILRRPFAPLERVLPHARALIHGGGIGALAIGWRAGVPMLMMPRAHDQFDNDRRAQQLGIAHKTKAPKWSRIMEDLLSDDDLRARIRQSGALVARENGADAAARAIVGAAS